MSNEGRLDALDQGSILSTFYVRIFHTNFFDKAKALLEKGHLYKKFACLTLMKLTVGVNFNKEPSIFLLQIFLLHKIQVALKSLWSFCDLVTTSNITMELKASAPHQYSTSSFYSSRSQKHKKDNQVVSLFLTFQNLHTKKLLIEH